MNQSTPIKISTLPSFFAERVALVTGASSGMGRSIAVAMGRRGACVGVHYRGNREGAEETIRLIEGSGGRGVALQADVSSEEQVVSLFEQLDDAFDGPLHLLVNNAGDWMDKMPIVNCPAAKWDQVFSVNARSVFLCCRQAAARMAAAGEGGSIVNLGSLAGHTGGGGGTVPYAAAKAAVHTFTRGLARELAGDRIRVNAVAPGMVSTPMLDGRMSEEASDQLARLTPAGRMGEPDEIAEPVLMLLSPGGSFITGQILDVNGGLLMR